ncbi:MAG TPA: cupredoxin domain-containing protein [Solirubrobacteraceae bacterium]|nr:cupredoxin domain-containing protein [Solirubrobacteraceae bacterium]
MRRTIAVLFAASALAVAGCGGDDEEDTESATTQPPAAETTPPETQSGSGGGGAAERVVLTDFEIDPANPTMEAGKATFDVVNEGDVPHALEIEGNGIEVETDVLDGGQSATLEADLKPGEYEWYCPVGNHADMGMAGTLTVE